jgi:hypothetical protein
MLKVGNKVIAPGAHVDVSFRDLAPFGFPFPAGHDIPGWPDDLGQVVLGDPQCGPLFSFITTIGGRDFDMMPPHGHASDSWRVSVRGEFRMGNVRYHESNFRLQRGWKNYPGDTYSIGPDGGWLGLLFADRRGTLMRLANPGDGVALVHDPASATAIPWVQETVGMDNDMFSDTTSEESAIASTLPEREQGWHVNSSFDQAAGWEQAGPGCRVAGIVMGQRERGPLVLLVHTEPGATSSSECAVDTDLLRLVVRGSALIGGDVYQAGDARIQSAGDLCPAVTAGPGGLDEVLVFGDRRGTNPSAVSAGWTASVQRLAKELTATLAA